MSTAPPDRSRLWFLLAIALVLGLGLALRLAHLHDVWSYWLPEYARYARPHWLELGDGRLPWDKLVGLHPPAWAALAAALVHLGASMRGLLAVPLLAWLASAILGAALLARVGGRVAALGFVAVLAIAPYQVHYALELNNYPLLQLGTAALAAAIAASWTTPTRVRLTILAAVVGMNLWCHFASAPLILALGICALATKRWPLALATVAGVLLASPVLFEAASLAGASQTFHNEPLAGAELGRVLLRVWRVRFVPDGATASVLGGTVLAAGFALRGPRTRALGFLLAMLLCVAGVWVLAGFSSGASFYRQAPYWIACSWIATALLGLGAGAAPGWGRGLLLVVLTPWLLGVAGHAAAGPTSWDLSGAPDQITDYLRDDVDPAAGDALVYLWDGYGNDLPHLRDPFHAAFEPRDLIPFVPASEPMALWTSRWKGAGRLTQIRDAAMRGGPVDAELSAAVVAWTADGRVVHLVQPGWEEHRGAPWPETMRAQLADAGVRWTEWQVGRSRLVRLER